MELAVHKNEGCCTKAEMREHEIDLTRPECSGRFVGTLAFGRDCLVFEHLGVDHVSKLGEQRKERR